MYGNGAEPFQDRVLAQPVFRIEYQNRLREIRDLLFNRDQGERLIDECAAIIADPQGGPSPVDADRAKWDYHPVMAPGGKAGQGLFYQIAPSKDFRGMIQLMKDYVTKRSAWVDQSLLTDPKIPDTPTVRFTGEPGFPPQGLKFRASLYQGTHSFAVREWRLAEVAPPPAHAGRLTAPGRYEIIPVWESGEQTQDILELTLPSAAVTPDRTYRVRGRVKDATGRWSHWSAPVEFATGPAAANR